MPDKHNNKYARQRTSCLFFWRHILSFENLPDLLSSHNNSADFNGTRAMQIASRACILTALFAVLALLWIAIDRITLNSSIFYDILPGRLALIAVFGGLALYTSRFQNLNLSRFRLLILMLAPALFYVFSQTHLPSVTAGTITTDTNSFVSLGYSFYPFVLIIQLAIFPLTLIECVLLTLPVLLCVAWAGYLTDKLWSVQLLEQFWLLFLLMMVAWWASLSQLNLLLRLYRQATHDPLTGLANRRLFMQQLATEIERAQRYRHPMSLIIFDLDHFKHVNDNYGHLQGDEVLKRFARLMVDTIRGNDLAGRYGGEEFIVLLPETPAHTAAEVAERIRQACTAQPVIVSRERHISFTASAGIAQLHPDEQAEQLINRADSSLYKAKETGRNRIVLVN